MVAQEVYPLVLLQDYLISFIDCVTVALLLRFDELLNAIKLGANLSHLGIDGEEDLLRAQNLQLFARQTTRVPSREHRHGEFIVEVDGWQAVMGDGRPRILQPGSTRVVVRRELQLRQPVGIHVLNGILGTHYTRILVENGRLMVLNSQIARATSLRFIMLNWLLHVSRVVQFLSLVV